jgi:phospholipase/carboxylesterase
MAALAPDLDPRLIVVSVRSPIELAPFAFGWYRVDFRPDGPSVDAVDVAAGGQRAEAFVGEAAAALDADPGRVFVGGFSQGGIVALATLLHTPEAIAGAVCMSGRLPPELLARIAAPERLRGKPVLIVHGVADDVLTIDRGRAAADELRARGLRVDALEFPMGHTTSPASLAAVAAWLTARLDETEAGGSAGDQGRRRAT